MNRKYLNENIINVRLYLVEVFYMRFDCKIVCVFLTLTKLGLKLLPQKYRHKQKRMSKMFYSESEPEFSNSLSTLALIFSEAKSESHYSESDFSSVFMNLGICVFLRYIYTLLNRLVDDFFHQYL